MNDQNTANNQDNSYVDNYQPPVNNSNQATTNDNQSSQTLESQNVFYLLGVQKSQPQEQESFLDELQQVIWEDFLESDAKLLITTNEYEQLQQLMNKTDVSEADKQEQMVVFLEKLIPDLEEIMLEKAIALKADMFRERVAGLREYYQGQSQQLEQVEKADQLMSQNKWYDAATALNQLQ